MNRVPNKKLVITVSETERWHGRSTYLALLELFQHKGLAAASATRAIAGYAGDEALHTVQFADVIVDLPVRLEVVDTAPNIERVLPDVYDMVEHGLVEVQNTEIIKFSAKNAFSPRPSKEPLMRLIGKAKMLRVHVGERDQWEGEPLYEAVVKRARQLDIAGATVYRGVLGYGAHRRIHKHKSMSLSHDDPILITVIDTEEKINQLLSALDTMVSGGCLIAISDVTVVKYAEHSEDTRGVSTVPDEPKP